MKIPVLCYHASFVNGDAYQDNNLVAFSEDLKLIDQLGFKVIPLLLAVLAFKRKSPIPEKAVAITLDDGTDFDYFDIRHPVHGQQRSMLNRMMDFVAEFGCERQPLLHATSFVVASPAARDELDARCLFGKRWYNDNWWAAAVATNLIGVANHSWDHNHPETTSSHADSKRGTFRSIVSIELANYQIRRAQEYIVALAPNPATTLFAYPYGESNDYLINEYFPRFAADLGITAAFSTEPAPITDACLQWNLPRFACATHWKSQEDLALILRESSRSFA